MSPPSVPPPSRSPWCRATADHHTRPPSPRPGRLQRAAGQGRQGQRHRPAGRRRPEGPGHRGEEEGRGRRRGTPRRRRPRRGGREGRPPRRRRPPPRPPRRRRPPQPRAEGRSREPLDAAHQASRRSPRRRYANNLDGWIKQSLDIMKPKGIPGTYDGIHRNIMRESSRQPEGHQQLGHQRHQRHPLQGPAPGHRPDLQRVPRRRHLVEHLRPGRQHHRRLQLRGRQLRLDGQRQLRVLRPARTSALRTPKGGTPVGVPPFGVVRACATTCA